ncbi:MULTISPECIES: restriction endonuclease subunit S [Citrobacter]|uniref:restriction endonuclease subunit S n=1 Tax=Citrobacter TaxID=544 RepID=UPI0011EE995C|nr:MULTISPECIES: restriction endonuclease subunit S [Citrobacter]KAA0552034.1 restriction endonuclease subunit S [Citrobacter braakii]MDM3339840.1 restriction endonuclease subunit S [Citrobacter sp. Cb043]MDM3399223.1 restriction endonuclease subunit S [Citrobacter sp. Cb016]HEB0893968.1 restriction endonuclease subunit S [Citrobacter braakii]
MAKYKAYPQYKDSGVEWLGEIPIDWSLKKAKYIFQKVQRPPRNIDSVVTAFRDGQVTLRTNRRIDGFTNSIKEIGYQGVRSGDLMIHAMDGFAGAIGISDSDGKCSPVCSVCIPWIKQSVNMLFYGYLVRQLAVTDFILSLAKGIRERSTEFRFSEFSGLVLAIPSKDEQDKIVAFLKHETQKIDRLISKQQQLIELLKEKRHAVISHVVTKGLNPNVPMKDSGVEWVDSIPFHWEVMPTFSICEASMKKNYDGIESNVLSLSYGKIIPRNVDTNYGLLPESFNTYQIVECRDIILRLTDLQNDKNSLRVGLVKQKGIITSAYLKLKSKSRISPDFLYQLLHSYDTTKVFYGMGGGLRQSMKFEDFRRLPLLLPPTNEQKKIAVFLDQETTKIDNLLEKQQQIIQLLQERRTALISAAVTGKIDVRNWVAPGEQAKAESPAEAFA